MNDSESPRYSSFWAVTIYLVAVAILTLTQTIKLHRIKLGMLKSYTQTAEAQKQAVAQLVLLKDIRQDLLQLAPSDPEAAQIIQDFHLETPKQNAPPAGN